MTLDHIDNLSLSQEQIDRHTNELNSLRYLGAGLRSLAQTVAGIEAEVLSRLPSDRMYMSYGNDPELAWVPNDLLCCMFHWYSVSVHNYVQLVAWLSGKRDKDITGYIEAVIPEVRTFRNKIAAHFAKCDPWRDDTPASLEASTIYPICWRDDAFWANLFGMRLTQDSKSSSSGEHIKPWSLTKVHSTLVQRYWPDDGPRQSGDC